LIVTDQQVVADPSLAQSAFSSAATKVASTLGFACYALAGWIGIDSKTWTEGN